MDGDVVLTLSLARLYGHHANFAGTPRQAIADGYSAVDAVLSNRRLCDDRTHLRPHRDVGEIWSGRDRIGDSRGSSTFNRRDIPV